MEWEILWQSSLESTVCHNIIIIIEEEEEHVEEEREKGSLSSLSSSVTTQANTTQCDGTGFGNGQSEIYHLPAL